MNNSNFTINHPEANINLERVIALATKVEEKLKGRKPDTAVICGSGWKDLGSHVENPVKINMQEVGLPVPQATGHGAEIVVGKIGKSEVLVVTGRVHSYDGWSPKEVTLMVKVIARLGIGCLLITNASGGLADVNHNYNSDFRIGDLALITDILIDPAHLSPLQGPNDDELGPRFPAMNDITSPALRKIARSISNKLGEHSFDFRAGRYIMNKGPQYESVATIDNLVKNKMTDFVGMSTVPELIMAKYFGMQVLGITLISNLAAGIGGSIPSGEEVVDEGRKVIPRINAFAAALFSESDFISEAQKSATKIKETKIYTYKR
ncbi:purine-nucleoside phosphorylase [Candidatus Riflebacteria bacterium]